jgi:hypothetical protein
VRILNAAGVYVGVMGARVTLSTGATFATGYDGYYFFSGLRNGTYSATATATGLICTPYGFTNPFAVSGRNLTGLYFNTVKAPPPPRTGVSGRVVVYKPDSTGRAVAEGLGDVLVSALSDSSYQVRTDSSGNYLIPNLPNDSYLVLPSKRAYSFDPSLKTLTVANNIPAFTFKTYSVYGQVYRLSGTTRVPLAGAVVSLNGVARFKTGADGKYLVSGLPASVQKVTVTLAGYSFATNRTGTVNSVTPVAKVDFQGTSTAAIAAPDLAPIEEAPVAPALSGSANAF